MPFFSGNTISYLMATSFWSLDICYNMYCLSTTTSHTSIILIGLNNPSNRLFWPTIFKNTFEKSLCGPCTTIKGPVPSRDYDEWINIVDYLGLINISKMAPLSLPWFPPTSFSYYASKFYMITVFGVFLYQIPLLCVLVTQILAPAEPLLMMQFFIL